jgi:hypothetical protein
MFKAVQSSQKSNYIIHIQKAYKHRYAIVREVELKFFMPLKQVSFLINDRAYFLRKSKLISGANVHLDYRRLHYFNITGEYDEFRLVNCEGKFTQVEAVRKAKPKVISSFFKC